MTNIRGADDLLPIFSYVIIKANVKDLYATLSFMEAFIDDEQLKGMGKYFQSFKNLLLIRWILFSYFTNSCFFN